MPGAPHDFHADYRASYRKEATEDAWNEMIACSRSTKCSPKGAPVLV
jgi:dienelactone hydrolase